MSILRFLGLQNEGVTSASTPETETIRKIARELDQLDPEQARYLAAFAAILSRVARADLQVSEEETRKMEQIVAEDGGLPERQAVLVVQIAKSQSLLLGGTENYLVAREFNKLATREQKRALLRCLFDVSAADDSISTVEDNVIRQIADELKLEHRDFIAVRSAFREHLAVLKKSPGKKSE